MKLKKSMLALIAALAVLSVAMTGCGKPDAGQQTPPVGDQEGQTPPAANGFDETSDDSVEALTALLGKTDDEVKDRFGGGTENKSEDGTTLLGRSYETELQGMAVTLETVYDSDGAVSGLSVLFTDSSMDDAKELFTAALGEPESIDDTQELESKYLRWTTDSVEVTLNESYGMVSAQMAAIG